MLSYRNINSKIIDCEFFRIINKDNNLENIFKNIDYCINNGFDDNSNINLIIRYILEYKNTNKKINILKYLLSNIINTDNIIYTIIKCMENIPNVYIKPISCDFDGDELQILNNNNNDMIILLLKNIKNISTIDIILNYFSNFKTSRLKNLLEEYNNMLVINNETIYDNLLICSRRGYDIILKKLLLYNSEKINQQDKYGYTALHYAAQYSHSVKTIKLLLEYGADIDIFTLELLFQIDITQFNIVYDDDPQIFNLYRNTLLIDICRKDHTYFSIMPKDICNMIIEFLS
jgi:hypothetical protein